MHNRRIKNKRVPLNPVLLKIILKNKSKSNRGGCYEPKN